MKTLLLSTVSLGLLLMMDRPAARAEDEAPNAAPMKQVPTPGRLEIEVTAGERVKSFTHPSKALSEIGRALSRAKRAKEGEEPAFEAALTLNDQLFTFSDPEAALEACKALALAMRDLPKLKMGLGDLGDIPEVKPEDQPQPGAPTNTKPMGARSRAAAMAEVRRRINLALQRQMLGAGTGGVTIRIPNQAMMQQTIKQELEKARREGLLPDNTTAANLGGGDPREARKEAIVQTLAFTLGQADSASKADEKADAEKTDEDKPAETKAADDKPSEAKPPEAADN